MRDLTELGVTRPGGPENPRAAPDDEQFALFSREFGVTLPESYRALLRHANGGHPRAESFVPRDATADDIWSVDHFYHLDDEENAPESLWRATREWRPHLGENAVPVAADGGDNQVFLDFSTTPPRVALAVFDGQLSVRPVAESFEEFLDLLHADPDLI